ncbi:hypothetical protein Q6D67_18430 [Haliea sp. E1-2-M8]|uniref:hypothetical protein n=1 Tax=Haliea sp. E1-2-M8 TaxID=3064706 RepID=UPI00271E9BEB|nr:hypothetical protein [Haliea sp. E1-2-M8]MDO8863674.1 hypothetical protein [Haliea sp. E1-2-M8]
MFKKILFHALVGGAIFIVGAGLHDFADIRGLGNFLAYGGMVYAGVTTLLILLGVNLPPQIGNRSGSSFIGKVGKDFSQRKAREELLEYKNLLDEGVLTQDEFNTKAAELKKKIL